MRGATWIGPKCPQDAAHGVLLDWPSATAAYFCPHARHTGLRFFTTDLDAASRPVTVSPLRSRGDGSHDEGTVAPVSPPSRRADLSPGQPKG